MGRRPQTVKDYFLLSWLDFGIWESTAAKMVLSFTAQMVRAKLDTFLAELFVELRRDCLRFRDAWLLLVLELLSSGLSLTRNACSVARVDCMVQHLRSENLIFYKNS